MRDYVLDTSLGMPTPCFDGHVSSLDEVHTRPFFLVPPFPLETTPEDNMQIRMEELKI